VASVPEVLQLLGPSTGGIRQHVAALTRALVARGWVVRTAGPAGVLDGLVEQSAVVPVPRGRAALARAADGVDLVHAHGLKAGWLASTLRRRPPLVLSVHNLVLDEAAGRAAPALRALESWLPRRVDAVIAVSEEIGRRFGSHPHVHVIPPIGPAPAVTRSRDDVRRDLGVAPDERLVVSVARLHPQKDLPTLFAAVAGIERTRVVVFGEGPDEPALRQSAPANVVLAGSRATVGDEIAAADLFVVSSRWESGPLVLLEAMALGRPVVTTRVGLAPKVVRDGETGRLVDVGDVASLRAAITDLLDDPVHAAAMGERGRVAAAATFGADALVARVEAVYREVLG
jgi:glycosyltransferase involved in cell wall biosynthesis